jgi:hypothetical protein
MAMDEKPSQSWTGRDWVGLGCLVVLGIAALVAVALIALYLVFIWYVGPNYPR